MNRRSGLWPGVIVVVIVVVPLAACGLAAGSGRAGPGEPPAGARGQAPPGYVTMRVVDVEEQGVILAEPGAGRYLPIAVGQEQALAVLLRLKKERYRRPLTHDLLDRIVDEMGGRVEWVQIVRLDGTTFIGSVTLRSRERVFSIDARSSDAIIIALGRRVPIYVAAGVLEAEGVRLDTPIDSGIPDCDRVLRRFLRCADAERSLGERVALHAGAHAHARALRGTAGDARAEARASCLAQEQKLEAQFGDHACWVDAPAGA
jgi:bifunctional DNase/RNase